MSLLSLLLEVDGQLGWKIPGGWPTYLAGPAGLSTRGSGFSCLWPGPLPTVSCLLVAESIQAHGILAALLSTASCKRRPDSSRGETDSLFW